MISRLFLIVAFTALTISLMGCQGLSNETNLTVSMAGSGTGTITSTPAGIDCPSTCYANFNTSQITLTATPGTGYSFAGWTAGCSGSGTTCTVPRGVTAVTAQFSAGLQSINHIIFFIQENRSLDSYFGALRQYWAKNGYPDQPFDGLPQFDPSGDPNAGPPPTNPGCDPGTSSTTYCAIDSGSPTLKSTHFQTMCLETPSPFWNEAHVQWDVHDPVSPPPPLLNGFVQAAANDARQPTPHFNDVAGFRVMGYYDGTDLNYYYFMASNFATSDRWFAPVMTRTTPNRQYLLGATSHGYVYPNGDFPTDDAQIPSPPIFEELQNANPPISWKMYVNPAGTGCNPSDSACLINFTYVMDFTYGNTIRQTPSLLQNVVSISQFMTDAKNGTLPQVAYIAPASNAGLDEHPADNDPGPGQGPCCSIQAGANYASGLINAVMSSPNWKDSVLILTWDEWGGFYDHVAPQPTVNPDGIPPDDLQPGDVCTKAVGPNCDFVFTGYRIPVIVVSPFTKKNYVSHTVYDSTAILKLIETRFGLPALNKRDAAQPDMSQDFFDFANVPWKTPPTPPAQNTSGPCYLDHLP